MPFGYYFRLARLAPDTSRFMKESDHQNQDAALSYRDARRIVGLVFLLVIVWFILRSLQPLVLLFSIIFLLDMVLNPIVVWLQKHHVPRLASVILLMLTLVAVTGTIILFAIPPLARQSQELVQSAPKVWQGIRARIESLTQNYPAVREALPRSDEIAGRVGAAAGTVGNILLRSTLGLVGGVASFVFGILLLIFVLANPRPLVAAYLALVPARYREQAHRTLARLMRQMIAWARGVAINGVITGLSIGVLLWLIGVQPALMFGVFAFLGEFLPNIGAFLVAIPILLIALSLGATKFWLALGVIVLVYQVELNVLVPGVLGKEMRLQPVNILFFTLATATLFGLLGVFLAVPAAPLVLLFASPDANSKISTGRKQTLGQSGTLQKMIVASGSVSMDIDLNRINGVNSTTRKLETLHFGVAPSSFFPVLVFNKVLRRAETGSMALVPQNNVALPAALTASVNSLTIEQAHPGETFNMVVRDAMSGFVFFNIEGNLHYDASTQLLGIQDGLLLISKALASSLGRAREAGTQAGTISIDTAVTPISTSTVVNGNVESSTLPPGNELDPV